MMLQNKGCDVINKGMDVCATVVTVMMLQSYVTVMMSQSNGCSGRGLFGDG
jgi:hypothetical protein